MTLTIGDIFCSCRNIKLHDRITVKCFNNNILFSGDFEDLHPSLDSMEIENFEILDHEAVFNMLNHIEWDSDKSDYVEYGIEEVAP